jgi:hypothetical protein
MYVQPSTDFEAVAQFQTGLTGTIGVRVTDNEGATTIARVTAGIAEYPAGSGIYAVTLTSPGTPGQYSLVWDDGADNWATDELVVTTDTVTTVVVGTGNLYITAADLKDILSLKAGTYADTAIGIACQAASRSIDGYKGARYYPTTEIRKYTNRQTFADSIAVDDIVSLTSVQIDTDGDLAYDETWAVGTDFVLEPANNALEGKPYTTVQLIPKANRRFPTTPQAVRVAGSFGWAAAPEQVTAAAVLLAHRFLNRFRSAPLGILVVNANDMVATARVGRIDPDAAFLLDQLPAGKSRPGHASPQLA